MLNIFFYKIPKIAKKIFKNYKNFEKKFNMGAYGKFLLPYAPMLNIFLQNSKKFQKVYGENIKKILKKIFKNYKNFEKKINIGAYGEMILTWVHMRNLYSHMHPC